MRRMARTGKGAEVQTVVQPAQIIAARKILNQMYIDERVEEYIVDLVVATREPKKFRLNSVAPMISYGASPRATISLNLASRAHAFLQHRAYVTPEDVKSIAMDVLRHRIALTYEAEAEEISSDKIVQKILDNIEVP